MQIGGFDGSVQYTTKENGKDVKKVETSQYFNYKQAELEEQQGGNSTGTNGIHELLESYIGAVDKPRSAAFVMLRNNYLHEMLKLAHRI